MLSQKLGKMRYLHRHVFIIKKIKWTSSTETLFHLTSRVANSLRSPRVTVWLVALADIPVCRESGSTRFSSM